MTPEANDTPVLKGVHVTRTYGDGAKRRAALRDVSIDLFPAQITLLMGPSGSGKSTLLAVLSGLLEPDSGQVLAEDGGELRDVWAMTPKQREEFRLRTTGFVFQGYNLFPALNARQQLEIVLKWGGYAGSSEARRQADRMLERLGLTPNRHPKPSPPSRGEKQRGAVGRAPGEARPAPDPPRQAAPPLRRREAAGGDRPGAGEEPAVRVR